MGKDPFVKAKAHLYNIIRQERPYFEDRIDIRDFFRVFVVEPQRSFERLRAQSGAFLFSAFHERYERSEILQWNQHIPIYSHSVLKLPQAHKDLALEELRLLNVTRETLFPSVDEARECCDAAVSPSNPIDTSPSIRVQRVAWEISTSKKGPKTMMGGCDLTNQNGPCANRKIAV